MHIAEVLLDIFVAKQGRQFATFFLLKISLNKSVIILVIMGNVFERACIY